MDIAMCAQRRMAMWYIGLRYYRRMKSGLGAHWIDDKSIAV